MKHSNIHMDRDVENISNAGYAVSTTPDWYRWPLVAAICIVMQLPPLLFGVELADMGFYMTFYRYFFSSPESVSYNFMFWLSGLIGATWMRIFGDSLIAMRVLGLLCNTASALILYSIFGRRYRREALCAIVCILAANMAEPLTFNYNTITVLLALGGVACMLSGLRLSETRGRLIRLCIGGLLIGINTLSRVSNIVGILFILLIPISAFYDKYGKSAPAGKAPVGSRSARLWCDSLCWLAAWIAGILTDIAIMTVLGQISAFRHGMEMLFNVGASGNTEASHSLGNLLSALIVSWIEALKVGLMLAIPYLIAVGGGFLRHKSRILCYTVRFTALIITAVIIYRASGTSALLGGASAVGSVALLLTHRHDRRLSLAAWAGLAIVLLLPAGSDYGINNMGAILFWIPLCSAFILIDGKWIWREGRRFSAGRFSAPVTTLIFVAFMAYSVVTNGVYFDSAPLREMNQSVNAREARGVLTTGERSRVVNRILAGMDTVVKSDEPVVVYGAAPSLYWLSGTRPISSLIWPEQLSAPNLHAVLDTLSMRPKVVILKFNTVGYTFGAPSAEFAHGLVGENDYHTRSKCDEIFRFVSDRNYRLWVDDPYYYLYVPEEGHGK